MKVGKNDLFSIVCYGLGSALIGSTYQLGSVYLKSKIPTLSVETEALDKDHGLLLLFQQLDECKKYDEVAFIRAVDAADRLVFVRFKLESMASAGLHERNAGYAHFKSVQTNVKRLVESMRADGNCSPQSVTSYSKMCASVIERAEAHLVHIMKLTKTAEEMEAMFDEVE